MKPIKLKNPKSLSLVYSVFPLLKKQAIVAYSAAIGICWAGKPLDGDVYGPMHEYGHGIFDQLTAAGYSIDDICASGVQAIVLLQELLPGAEEVDEVEGNSDAKDAQ